MAMYSSRVIWGQFKEPALSAPLVRFVNPQEDSLTLPYDLPDAIEDYTKEDIIEIAKAAEIVDETDGKSLYKKLEQAAVQKNAAIVINAIDDEPYVSSRINPLIALREEVIGGIALCQILTGADTEDVYITVYRHLMDIESNIPSRIDKYKVTRLGGGYPARPTSSQLRHLRRRNRLSIGIGAIIHLFRAVAFGKRQTTSFVTVHGNAVANPMNLEVSFDMSVSQVLERCGLVQEPTRVVVGGPMTGFAVLDTDKTLITPTTRAVLAFVRKEQEFRYSCIGCGRCERACPVGLNPMYIERFIASGNHSMLAFYDPQNCIGCGMCSYVCPSRLKVAVSVLNAKHMVQTGKATLPKVEYSWQDFKATVRYVFNAIWNRTKTVSCAIGRGIKKTALLIGKILIILGVLLWKGITLVAAGTTKVAKKAGKFLKKTGKSAKLSFTAWRAKSAMKKMEQQIKQEESTTNTEKLEAQRQETARQALAKEAVLQELKIAKQQHAQEQERAVVEQITPQTKDADFTEQDETGAAPPTSSPDNLTYLADFRPPITPIKETPFVPVTKKEPVLTEQTTIPKEEQDEV